MTRLRTPAEIAPDLRMDANKIRQLIRRGELGAVKKYPGRQRPTYLISDADVARYLEANAA